MEHRKAAGSKKTRWCTDVVTEVRFGRALEREENAPLYPVGMPVWVFMGDGTNRPSLKLTQKVSPPV